jgi:peptide/nickel transport system substrate-binding protein
MTLQNAVILPGVYARSLLYRNPDLTNVYVSRYYAMYDYSGIGLR